MAQGHPPQKKINCIDARRTIQGVARRYAQGVVSARIDCLRRRFDGRPSDGLAIGQNASWQHEGRLRDDVN